MSLFNVTLDYSNDSAVNLADYIACVTVPYSGMGNFFDMSLMTGAQWLHANGYSFWMIDLSEQTYTNDTDSGPNFLLSVW